MTTDAGAADSGALSIDQASALLGDLPRKETEQPQAPVEQEQPAVQPEAAEGQGPEPETEQAPEGEADGEEQQGEQPETELPALEAPQFLKAAVKAKWAELPREVQQGLIEQEQERTSATGRALQDSAEKRKAADQERERYSHLANATSAVLDQAQSTFKSRWENVDWDAVQAQYGTDQAFKLKTQMENEQRIVQQLEAAKNVAEQEQTRSFRAERVEQFRTLIPDFVDPKIGPAKQQEVFNFLRNVGVPEDTIVNRASAVELAIAYDAMKWRNAQATAKTLASAPKQPAQPKRTPVKPGAAPVQRSTQQSRIDTLSRKRELSIDEAVELATLRENPQ